MTLKSDAKFEAKPTLGSKNGMLNFVNFNVSSGKSENLQFDVLLCQKHVKFRLKKYSGIISYDTEDVWKP